MSPSWIGEDASSRQGWISGCGPSSASAISWPLATAWKSAPVMTSSWCSWSLSQRESGEPDMYQEEPLSARMMPCCFIASAMIRAAPVKCDVSKSDRSRNHAPIGGADALVVDPASWRAGQM